MSNDEVINLAEHRSIPGTEWVSYCGQCIACGYQAMHVAAFPDWAETAPTPDCHKCGAVRAVLPRRSMPEQMNDGSAQPWVRPPEPLASPIPTEGPDQDAIAGLTLRILYYKPNDGQLTSLVMVEAIESSIQLEGHWLSGLPRDVVRVWGVDGERIGAELHRCILSAAELVLEPWTDEAERLQVEYAEAHRPLPTEP
jgi:hypothetical protein